MVVKNYEWNSKKWESLFPEKKQQNKTNKQINKERKQQKTKNKQNKINKNQQVSLFSFKIKELKPQESAFIHINTTNFS